MNVRKIARRRVLILGSVILVILIVISSSYLTGAYFVDFALRRGNPQDPYAPPPAAAEIADKNLKIPPAPDFPCEDWTVAALDGLKLKAVHYKPKQNTHNWAILIHGYARDGRYAHHYADQYLKQGFEVLLPDLRASGRSEGHYLTMGVSESLDLAQWEKLILERDPDAEIVLHGVSMGASTALLAAGFAGLKSLKAVIADCGYSDVRELFTKELKALFGLPAFPVIDIFDVVCHLKIGISIMSPTPLTAAAASDVPVLFFHGDRDTLVPPGMMADLYAASRAKLKRQVLVTGAGHAGAMGADYQAYFRTVFAFIAEALAQERPENIP